MIALQRLALVLLAGAVLVVGGLLVKSHEAGASSPHSYATVVVPDLTLGVPSSVAHLTSASALSLVKKKLNPHLFTHPFSVEYGSFTSSGISRRLSGAPSAPQLLRTRDVWKVTVTGLKIARPCGSHGSCPPPESTLVIFVDDKTGQVLYAQGF